MNPQPDPSEATTSHPDDARVVGRLSALDRYLPVWILIAMAIGLLLGRMFGGLNDTLDTIKIDTVELAESLYSVDYTTGIVTLDTAPNSGESITATFDFDVPMRFDTDYLPTNLETLNARGATIPLVEIRV